MGFLGLGTLAAMVALHGTMRSGGAVGLWCAGAWLPGVAAWLVWRRVDVGLHRKQRALRLWGWAVLAQAAWPGVAPLAHGVGLPLVHSVGAGYAGLVVASGLTGWAVRAFWPLGRGAAAMLLPYSAAIAVAAWPGAGL